MKGSRALLALALLAAGQALSAATLPSRPWTGFVQPGQTARQADLDLRALPADTRPAAITVDADLRGLAPGREVALTAAINGRVFHREWLTGGTEAHRSLPVEQKLFSVSNRIDVAVTESGCEGACPTPAAQVTRIGVALAPVEADITDFSRAVTTLRRGLTVNAGSAQDRALAERVIAALAPLAPRAPAGPSRIVVGPSPPPGLEPPLPLDGRSRLNAKSGTTLYDDAALARFTIVQLIPQEKGVTIWVRPGSDPDLPARFELHHGDVTLFGAGRREIGFSSQSDEVIRIERALPPGALSATQIRIASVFVLWLIASVGLFLFARRLPAPKKSVA